MRAPHKENHLVERIGWLRAAMLGATDGVVPTALVSADSRPRRNANIQRVTALISAETYR